MVQGTSRIMKEMFPSAPRFTLDQIPDLTGKVMMVTGGNTGIGKETAKVLLQHGAKVYIAARSPAKAEAAIQNLKELTGRESYFVKIDLADLKSIKAGAADFQSKERELHVLFNSGGVMIPPLDQLTTDGYDLQFGTNVLGHFYLTTLLLPSLLAGAKSSPDGHARVITTSSSTAYHVKSIDFDAIRDGPARRKMGKQGLYSQSKFANIVFALELARRYADQGIISISLNPGNIKTDLQRHMTSVQKLVVNRLLYPTWYGTLSQLWGGTMPEALGAQGKYLVPWARIGEPVQGSEDPQLGRELWTWLEEQVVSV